MAAKNQEIIGCLAKLLYFARDSISWIFSVKKQ
jgi:hypothetical protein